MIDNKITLRIKNKGGLKRMVSTGLVLFGRVCEFELSEVGEELILTYNKINEQQINKVLEFLKLEVIKE